MEVTNEPDGSINVCMERMMLRATHLWLMHHAPGRRVRTLARKGIGLTIFLGGSAVIVVYLLRCLMEG
jgi:hypothetical protein